MKKSNPKINMFSKFLKEFQSESDRGAAILGASMLDEKLKAVTKSFLIDCKQSKELIEGYNAALGTFSSRLNLCFAMGLLSQNEYEDCNTIRKIRNDFAHKFELDFSFSDKRISSLCWNLHANLPGEKEDFKDKPRFIFVNGVISLYMSWMYREEYVKKIKLKIYDWENITWNTNEIKK